MLANEALEPLALLQSWLGRHRRISGRVDALDHVVELLDIVVVRRVHHFTLRSVYYGDEREHGHARPMGPKKKRDDLWRR